MVPFTVVALFATVAAAVAIVPAVAVVALGQARVRYSACTPVRCHI